MRASPVLASHPGLKFENISEQFENLPANVEKAKQHDSSGNKTALMPGLHSVQRVSLEVGPGLDMGFAMVTES